MSTISVCMIVRNEEDVLARCLDSVQLFADEIIVVDTGSTDRTKEIALRYTPHVHDYLWNDDFASARNFSFSLATMDYQMWIDADDVIPLESVQQLNNLKSNLSADVVFLPYQVAFDAFGNPTLTYERERILKRSCQFQWNGRVHEVITPKGNIVHAEPVIQHRKHHVGDPDRNLRIYEKQRQEGVAFSTRELYYYARELFYHDRISDAVQNFTRFLERPDGWIEDKINACLILSKCFPDNPEMKEFSLFRSFLYDRPRAEICCEIGRIRFEQGKYREAIFWYECAVSAPLQENGFQNPDCYDYIPYMQLCVCYDRMGNTFTAKTYNDKAGRIKPKDKAFLLNQKYFREKCKNR